MTALNLSGGFWRDGELITADRVLAAARRAAADWPADAPAINDCDDRIGFAVTLLAAAFRGVPALLPGSGAPAVIADLQRRFPGAHHVRMSAPVGTERCTEAPEWPADTPAVIGFTSGSTGTPKAIPKFWTTLLGDAAQLGARLERYGLPQAQAVATVPPQHMYGLEMSILLALFGGWQVDAGRPFYPADVETALDALDGPRVLVTTPVHLRALAAAPLPPLAAIVSATAPLDAELAARFGTDRCSRLLEVYGCTETGAIATRDRRDGDAWTLYDNTRFSAPPGPAIDAGHLGSATLPDAIEVIDSQRFRLVGRPDAMLKVGGKRLSIDELTHHLLGIDGVADAAVWRRSGHDRPAAAVIAPRLTARQIAAELAKRVDPVFVPRPLRVVGEIPRTNTGKVTAETQAALLG